MSLAGLAFRVRSRYGDLSEIKIAFRDPPEYPTLNFAPSGKPLLAPYPAERMTAWPVSK